MSTKRENPVYVGEAFDFVAKHDGREYRATIEHDDSHGRPWDESDGHCPVFEVSTSYGTEYGDSKKPSEWVIHRGDRRQYSYAVDMVDCLAIARRDGWGAPESDVAEFVAKNGRQPTEKETAVLAVLADIKFLVGWINDEWRYVGVIVHPLDDKGDICEDESQSLWGLESCAGNYIRDDVCQELAAECTVPESAYSLGTDE